MAAPTAGPSPAPADPHAAARGALDAVAKARMLGTSAAWWRAATASLDAARACLAAGARQGAAR